MTALVSLEGVTRRFGDVVAVDNLDLEIQPGQILGLLGPNGAGKSTVLALIQGLRRPTAGRVRLFGGDPTDYRSRIHLGATPQETALPATLRVGEVIDFVGRHYLDPVPVDELAARFGLGDLLRRQTGALSGGQRRRVSVALAFAGRPKLVLLDEPTTGLDVSGRAELWDAVKREHNDGATVVLTSHYLEEIEALADRVVVIDRGIALADDTLPGVLARVGTQVVNLRSPRLEEIALLDDVVHVDDTQESATLTVHNADRFVTALVRSGLPFEGLAVRGASLEEAFLSLTRAAETATEKEVA
ncbi:MAG: ABC transporter ATP-binding protein [Pseudolysinimonas sp.]